MKRKILSSDFYNIEIYDGTKSYCVKKLPTLYKYQSVSEYSLTNLSNGEIWGTIPKAFNDPYDSSCCYTYSLLKKAIITELNKDRLDCFRIIFKTKNRGPLDTKKFQKTYLERLSRKNYFKLYGKKERRYWIVARYFPVEFFLGCFYGVIERIRGE